MPANIKEIDKRIRSVRNTQQITNAMKMVAAAKLRRAQDRLQSGLPYGQKLNELMSELAGTQMEHPLFQKKECSKRLVVIVSSDKGLCGSYNANIIREAHHWLERQSAEDSLENELYTIGRKATDYFKRRSWTLRKSVDDLGGAIDIHRFHGIADELMDLFLKGEYREVHIFYTKFISTLSCSPTLMQLLPMTEDVGDKPDDSSKKNYIYVPAADEVLRLLLPKSIRNQVSNALAEAFTSEHGQRMTSMGSATDNAGELIDKLVLFRNRARQAAITQEISEIVGGADALS